MGGSRHPSITGSHLIGGNTHESEETRRFDGATATRGRRARGRHRYRCRRDRAGRLLAPLQERPDRLLGGGTSNRDCDGHGGWDDNDEDDDAYHDDAYHDDHDNRAASSNDNDDDRDAASDDRDAASDDRDAASDERAHSLAIERTVRFATVAFGNSASGSYR
jgi:hypothetical protein